MQGSHSAFIQRGNDEESETSESTWFVPLDPQMGKLRLREVKGLTSSLGEGMTKLGL